MEELNEVYQDVKEIEDQFQKTMKIANIIIKKHVELFWGYVQAQEIVKSSQKGQDKLS